MVLFVWLEEIILDKKYPTCKNYYPSAVVEAYNEREAWEILYQTNETLWWVLQGETNYKEGELEGNFAKELHNELRIKNQYKTRYAQEPVLSGNCATKKSNY